MWEMPCAKSPLVADPAIGELSEGFKSGAQRRRQGILNAARANYLGTIRGSRAIPASARGGAAWT